MHHTLWVSQRKMKGPPSVTLLKAIVSFVELKKAKLEKEKRRRKKRHLQPYQADWRDSKCYHIPGKHIQCIGREDKQKRITKKQEKRRKQIKEKQVSFVSFFFSCLKLLTLENRVSGKS